MTLREFVQRRGQEHRSRIGPGAKAHRANVAQQASCFEQNPSRTLHDHLPSGRDAYVPGVAVKQRHVQMLIDGLNASAQRWLTQMNALGGPGKASLFCKRDDVFELAKIHEIKLK